MPSSTRISNTPVRTLEMQYVSSVELPHAGAIVVLASVIGEAYPPQPVPHLGPELTAWVYAAAVQKESKAPLIVFSGNRSESAYMARVTEMMGVPRIAMIAEEPPCTIRTAALVI